MAHPGSPLAGGTPIEWCDFTFNPWWGCEKVSPGCAHCYADTLARRRAPGQELWGAGHAFRFFGDAHWQAPLRWARNAPAKLGRRPRVFCASMADVFEKRPELDEHRERLFNLIEMTPELDWLVLTKRPEFARTYLLGHRYRTVTNNDALRSCDPVIPHDVPNLWLGVSIENARHTWRADVLRQIPAAVRFVSAEPLLGSLFEVRGRVAGPRQALTGAEHGAGEGVTACLDAPSSGTRPRKPLDLSGIDWVIVGGESGPGARPMRLKWAWELVDACRLHDVAPFVKQLGAKPVYELGTGSGYQHTYPLRDRKGGEPSEWPPNLRVREWPRSAA